MGPRDQIPILLLLHSSMNISSVAIVIYVVNLLKYASQSEQSYSMYYTWFAYLDEQVTKQTCM